MIKTMTTIISIRIIRYLLPVLLLCSLTACDSQPEKTAETAPEPTTTAPVTTDKGVPTAKTPEAKVLLSAPFKAQLIETPEMALPVFRETLEQKPILVLMSNNPLLAPLPEPEKARINTLLTGPREQLKNAVAPFQTNPALISNMTITAALDAGYFSQVLWAVPTKSEKDVFSGARIKEQLLEIGAISEAESVTFQEDTDGSTVAIIRDIPWRIVRYTAIPKLEKEVVVYFDLGFFTPLYLGEIKTPLLQIFYNILSDLKAKNLRAFNLVICRNNLNGLPLETRFLANDLAAAFHDPQLITGDAPLQWKQRKNALYLENFMQNDKIHDLYRQMLADNPDDPSIKFGLYQILRRLKRVDEALDFLSQTVAADSYYGLEYLNLAAVAVEKKLRHKQLEMLEKARLTFPDNPFLTIEAARLLSEMGHKEQASLLVDDLLKLTWSPTYYSGITDYLRELSGSTTPQKAEK